MYRRRARGTIEHVHRRDFNWFDEVDHGHRLLLPRAQVAVIADVNPSGTLHSMDSAEVEMYMPDKRRLTAMRVDGFGLEKAFKVMQQVGLWALTLLHVATGAMEKASFGQRGHDTRDSVTGAVAKVHQKAIAAATTDIAYHLHEAGYANGFHSIC